MEVFDLGRGRWEALPSPPSLINPYFMVSAAFEDTKEILVSSLQPKSKNDQYQTCVLYSYDVRARSWTKLKSPPFKLRGGGSDLTFNRAVVAANTLHWFGLITRLNWFSKPTIYLPMLGSRVV